MNLRNVLANKGTKVHTVHPDASLKEVVCDFVRLNVGSLLVSAPDSHPDRPVIVGIITERDVLRAHAASRTPLDKLFVADAMTQDPVTASPDDSLEHAMHLMTSRRVRHLPIMEQARLMGIISIGDIVKFNHDMLVMENHYIKSYIQGEGGEVATTDRDF